MAAKYRVISVKYAGVDGWNSKLTEKLNEAAEDGWRPILYGDSGGQATVILEKTPPVNP
jgi:hypothetical protein